MAMAVSVRQLGVIGYRTCLALQQELVHTYKDKHLNKVCVMLGRRLCCLLGLPVDGTAPLHPYISSFRLGHNYCSWCKDGYVWE